MHWDEKYQLKYQLIELYISLCLLLLVFAFFKKSAPVPHQKSRSVLTRAGEKGKKHEYYYYYTMDRVPEIGFLFFRGFRVPGRRRSVTHCCTNRKVLIFIHIIICAYFQMKTPRKYKTLGLLDLYGFESLVEDPGGFEQLVFNFAAEKVQRVTLEWTMVLEQQEYAMEGVEWTHLNFLDNGQVVTMLERGSYGVFSILEEVCMSSNNIVMSVQQPPSAAVAAAAAVSSSSNNRSE